MQLEHGWTLYVLSRRDRNYESGVVPLLHIRSAKELWEAWDSGVTGILALLLDGSATVFAAGAEVYGVALFRGDARPEWSQHDGACPLRAPFNSADEALEHVLLAAGGTCHGLRGVRLLRGRADDGCRVEHWVDEQHAGALESAIAHHLRHTGHGTPALVRGKA